MNVVAGTDLRLASSKALIDDYFQESLLSLSVNLARISLRIHNLKDSHKAPVRSTRISSKNIHLLVVLPSIEQEPFRLPPR